MPQSKRIVFRIVVDRPVSKVWEFVGSPKYFQKWNDKIESIEVRDEFRLGEPFMANCKWQDKVTQCMSVVTTNESERVLELRHFDFVGVDVNPAMVAVERIVLAESRWGTPVTKVLSIWKHDAPLLFAPLL